MITNTARQALNLQEQFTTIKEKNGLLTSFGKVTLSNHLLPGEDYQDCFMRVALAYGDNLAHSQRIYYYISNLWFMPATPVLSNGGSKRGLPISCYLNETEDSLEGIVSLWNENVWLASHGGGIGSYWGNLRSIGEKIGQNGETCGIIPFIKVMDSMTLAISQGSLRRGSAAIYLPIDHPDIEEFIDIRKPTGGDPNRKALNLHHGIVISDAFMEAVQDDLEWHLRSPKDQSVVHTLSARSLWMKLLTARIEMGEPYLLFIDHVNKALPEHQKNLGLKVKSSNLCTEITLPTGKDKWGHERTAVCCLSSVNLEKYLEWENEPLFIEDCMRFLDNVLEDYINSAPEGMNRASYSATRERSVGLGVMGFHSFLQSQNIPMEGVMSKVWNNRIFKHIKEGADKASKLLAKEKGACHDARVCGIEERFSNKIAIAPTATISIIGGGASPGIEPYAANAYTHKTLSGSFLVKNKFLETLLEQKGQNNESTWTSILHTEGSVQHLDFLSQNEKDVFKTAFEIDQRWLIKLAAERQTHICQAQSLNLFLASNVHKRELHQFHFAAWQLGLKSLYYLRSKSLQRPESTKTENSYQNFSTDECLSCQ